ncbi:apolipoprotein B-100-like [Salarias fasciatus]|uniref:apolipoprotein B-100-like n=1 Tax=Salarias fasciatus TaxID=181472 RepID=UPI0011767BC6|nr:apolipoprotein B-100-like [Salarias fasciatus]
MWGPKLCLLLLLGTHALAQQDVGSVEDQSPVCFLAKRYKNFRRYVYDYEAEAFNGVTGASDSKSGPKVSCQVEIEVPQACSFVIRTTRCSLNEIFDRDDNGNPVYRLAAEAQAFSAAMEKNTLKVTVEGQTEVKLYPGEDEPINILNIKRGIVSALIVPVMEEEKNKEMPTVHGVCATDFTVNSREDIATEVTVDRDLSRCDWFFARRQDTSPLALISGMNYPLSKMISSTQTCNYQFDNQKKHMTSGTCTEKHIFLPLSYKNEYGISAVVRQTLNLRETAKINDRIFDRNEDNVKGLPLEVAEDKSAVQTKDAVITTMQTLSSLSQTNDREQRAGHFHKLVSELRALEADVLTSSTEEMMDISNPLTYQALAQCGTPACTSAMLKILSTFDAAALEVDAVVYALALLPNPSRLMVKDMLAMAQNRQSKPLMYALSNAARKLYKAEGLTPEITAVSEFMTSLLGADCAGEKELTFLTLRVVGNMGDAMEAADPAIKTTLLKCMRQPATTLSVQLAAIQAFRRMSVTDEVRSNLQRVSQYPKGAVQKRLAAYLMLMRTPQDSDIEMVKKLLTQEQNMQIKSFVTSHIYNIISSKASATKEISRKILDALQDTDIVPPSDFTTSRNYKLGMSKENMQANIQGNIIFDPSSQLPREVLLETTMEAFGFSMDIWEFGMEGKGLDPTIEALFGKNGFFPDTMSKALYWAEDKMQPKIREVLEKWTAPLKSEGQKVPENIFREIARNINKLVRELQNQDSPEAMAYLRLMGVELGYIKSSDLKSIAESAFMYAEIFMKLIPKEAIANLISKTDNELFAHYIFMDNKFILPTASGMPLKFALAGTFTPGAKGGLRFSRSMNELVFMPSVGVEFRTQMGIYIPEFVVSGVDMQTSLYHESALNAKLTTDRNQIRLSIPAPQGTTKFLRISNKVMIVASGYAMLIPHSLGEASCGSLFAGVRYCTKKHSADTTDKTDIPYFPLNGETSYAFDIKPSRGVSEYTATIAYELLTEGEDQDQMVDSLRMTLKAEGDMPTEATATMKFNRDRKMLTTEVQIPDFDVEAGIQVGLSDSDTDGKSLILQLTNKNVPQVSLIGRAKLNQASADSMVEVQLLVPSLRTDATVTATLTRVEGLKLEIKSDMKLSEVSSVQAVVFKYGDNQAEVQLISNTNADTKIPLQYASALREWTPLFMEDVMNQRIPKTNKKIGHIVSYGLGHANKIWMENFSTQFPYVEEVYNNVMNEVANIELPSVPDNLFMNFDSTFRYKFNENRLAVTVPLPLGGKSSEELRVPAVVTLPYINMPQLGVEIAAQEIQVPTFTIPSEYDLTLPLMGMVEMSAKVNSNFYNLEATASAGNATEDSPNYQAKFNILGDSSIQLLSFSVEGSTSVTDTAEEKMEFTLDSSLKHKLLNTGFSVLETITLTDNVLLTGNYKVYAASPVGLDTSLTATTQFTLDSNTLFGDLNTDGIVTLGPLTASTTYLHTFSAEPAKKEAKMESILRINSEILKIVNKMKASYENEELLFESNANLNSGPIRHTTKINLSYKDVKLAVQYDSVTKALERMVRSQLEFSASEGQASLRIENQADYAENRAYSLLTGSLSPSGLEINADASINLFSSLASHKATFTLTADGLTTSCTTTAQHSPLTFENAFHGEVGTSGATMSLTTKGAIQENKAELNVEGKIASTEVSLNSVFKGNLFDINGRNRINLKLNEDGVTLFNNLVGSFKEIRTDNTHSLSFSLRSFSLTSKTDNFLNEGNSYMHDISINMERFTASVSVKNDLKVMEINFVNDAKFTAEPYNMELSGTMMGVFSEEELKNTYEIKFVDMVLSATSNTNGKLLGGRLTHTTSAEVAGLTMKIDNVANFKCQSLRLDSTVKALVEPFALNIDAVFNSDGAVFLYGQQSGELYSKFLLKAEPLLFTQSFECRASTTHELEDNTIKTMMNNKFNSILSLQEQGFTLKVTSELNENTFNQEISAYNNVDRMGIELAGEVSAPIFSEIKEDYAISAFVKYDKNSDSHFIQIPFADRLPEVIESMKTAMMTLMETLKDFNSKFEISDRFQTKLVELKEVIDNFDFNLFTEDLKKFLGTVERFIADLTDKFPTDKVVEVLKKIKDAVMAWINKYDIANKFNAIYTKIEDVLSSYEIEKIIGSIMDEIVKILKQYQVREKIQHIVRSVQSIDIQPLVRKVMVPVQELLSFDIEQLIRDVQDYFMRVFQKIASFDYDTFTVELKDKVAEMSQIPCFGKLYGGFKVTSPHYNLITTADLENSTTTTVTPEFKMNFKSQAESTLKILDFNVDASATFTAPERSQLTFAENIKVDHSSFVLDHKGEMTIYGLTRAEASANIFAKVSTELYGAELTSIANIQMDNRISATMETGYKHDINMPLFNIFSEAKLNQKTVLLLEDSGLRLTLNNVASEKLAVKEFSDEVKHNSDIVVVIDIQKIKLTFTGETGSNNLKMIQNVVADIGILRDIIFDAKFETETPFLKDSVAEVKFTADVRELKVDFTASHRAELTGQFEGTVSNSLLASVTPAEITFDTKNNGNAKVFLPFKLSGKIDLQNDIAFTLNSAVQQASWTGLARFNQYKYSHFLSFDNGESEINIVSQINGEANLDILKERITLPEMKLPFVDRRMPRIEDFSLWENTILSDILKTTQQTFDMNSKVKYIKSPEIIAFDFDMEPITNAINSNVMTLHKRFHINKDKVADLLITSFGKAKAEYEKYSADFPETATVPAFKVPLIGMDVSSFTIPLPHPTMISVPALHIPSALTKLTIPKITLPRNVNIRIPALGDLTYEFSLKTAVITLKTDASILTQDSINMKLDASSASEFRLFAGTIEGNSIVNMEDGLKITSDLSLKHRFLEGNHESTIVLGLNNLETSITNSMMSRFFGPTAKIQQEFTTNPEEGLVFSMFSPSAGQIALQMQTKSPAQVKARLYGYYPSEPTTAIDILGVKMSVMDSNKLNIQTTWNMEIPNDLMLTLKQEVPQITQVVSEITEGTIRLPIEITRMFVRNSQLTFRRSVKYLSELDLSDMMNTVADNAIAILKEYQRKVEIVLDAVVQFLRQTKFQIPGYEQKMSGLEVYQTVSGFVADVAEEAVQKIPEYFTSVFAGVLDYFQSIEFTLPGSNSIVSGREIVDDLSAAFRKIQDQIIVTVRNLGSIQLEDIFNKVSGFVQFVIEQSEKLVETLKSEERISNFLTDVYQDAMNSKVLGDVVKQIEDAYRVVLEYIKTVDAKVRNILSDMSIDQFKADIQSWIDTLIKRINAFQNNVIRTLKEKTKNVEYVRVGDREVEVDIPLPIVARFM